MAATIAGSAVERKRKILPHPLHENVNGVRMVCVASSAKKVMGKQKDKRSVGSSKQQTCYICKKYSSKYADSTGACPNCGTCLCLNAKKRDISCLEEHINSGDPNIRCNGTKPVRFPVASRDDNYA